MEEAQSLQEQLFRSIWFPEIDQTKKILTEHPELINAKGSEDWTQGVYTPLVEACRFGRHEIVTFLLDNGADVSATGHFYSTPNIYGKSRKGGFGSRDDIFPLFVAVDREMGHSIFSIFNIHTVNALLSAGANTNQRTEIGQTALHVLCTSKNTFREFSLEDDDNTNSKMQIMRTLIDYGADVNICDHQGKSPLHYACLHGNRDLTKILLRKGADVYQEDEDGLTALDYAAVKDDHLTTALIEKYSFPITHIIRAYECVAFRATHPSEMLRKAALLREAHGFPKNVLSPAESFDFEKEWETIGEQEEYEDDLTRVFLQCLLARERIAIENNFDIPQDILDISILYRIWTSDQHQQIRFPSFNSLLRCRLDQFFYFGKYIYFTDLINKEGISLSYVVDMGSSLSTDVLVKYAQAAIESCLAIQSKLNFERKPSCAYELKNDMTFILYFIGGVILHLIKRSVNGLSQECDDDGTTRMTGSNVMHRVAKVMFDELLNRCPSVSAPYFGYSWPVAHLLNRKDFIIGRFVGGLYHIDLAAYCFKYNKQLLKMIADAQYDINATDWEGNTLLHIVMFKLDESTHLFEMVKVLLENGAYPHGKNKQGNCPADKLHEIQRHEPENNIISSIKGLIMKHDCTLALKCLTAGKIIDFKIPYYSKQLPKALVKFVNSH